MMIKVVNGPVHPARAKTKPGCKTSQSVLVAPSFNGRTAASGAAYRGSNP